MIPSPIEGRECGSCTACCTFLPIADTEIHKSANLPCLHCVDGGGCAIYPRRPTVCRDWHCMWRTSPALDETWRPDCSGFLIKQGDGDTIIFLAIGNVFSVFGNPFISVVFDLIRGGVPVELAMPGPPGFFPSSIELNERLGDAVDRRDMAAARSALAVILEALTAHEWKADEILCRYPA